MEPRYGLLLLSFTATFVGFVASRFWRITTLMLHRIYSTPDPRDALHHQRQGALRNSLSATSTLWTFLQLAWCWRRAENSWLARTLPTIISAASAFCVFTIAGGFTSSISSGIGNDVLIRGSQCGTLNSWSESVESLAIMNPWFSQNINNAANYAQQCYSANTTGNLNCGTFVRSRLQFNPVLNASCPFNDTICSSNDSNLLLDSGFISSDDFGLNLPSSQRMFYRELIHCAPLRTDGFVKNVSTKYDNYTRYSYGDWAGPASHNWTYEVEDLNAQYRRQADNPNHGTTKGLSLIALYVRTANGTVWDDDSEFLPIPQLSVPDGDLTVAFLSGNGVLYLNQTVDPWYRGTNPSRVVHYRGLDGNITLYGPEEAASPLGCVQRYQYCNALKECGSLASWHDALTSASTLFDQTPHDIEWSTETSPRLNAVASRFYMFESILNSASDLSDFPNSLGSSSLLSAQQYTQGLMGPLADNQWQLDVSHWFAMRMASMQAAFVDTAHGPRDESLLPYMSKANKYQQTMCDNQKILSTDYMSLSLFGLYFTYATGIIVILVSYIVEPLLSFWYAHRKYEEYKYLEWAANSTLQLQRLAYQGLGSEKWSNYTDDIPKTRPGYFLADLARAYPPGEDDDEIQEAKPTIQTNNTASPSTSDASATQSGAEQSRGASTDSVSAVSEPAPQD
ncbi:hypothetical protein N8I77_000321 [Diaporthe amygdali]|uniref:Uncharacterized protein n=1 Tax=Phomopsis amygdali TaxID=1214568 RepID=A0AAD9SLY2_PHOAM|nr:hypothetical protein N8I77_000321 [Diaporthe amygdali]